MRKLFSAALACLAVALSGCTALGLEQPQSLEDRLVYGVNQHTAALNAITTGLDAGEITAAEGEQFIGLAKESRTLLDAARVAAAAGDVATAEGKLNLAIAILGQLEAYMRSRKGSGGDVDARFIPDPGLPQTLAC